MTLPKDCYYYNRSIGIRRQYETEILHHSLNHCGHCSSNL